MCRHGIYISQPAVVNRNGATPLMEPMPLVTAEREQVLASVATMKKVLAEGSFI
jgi:malate/lactate dehydrogenase